MQDSLKALIKALMTALMKALISIGIISFAVWASNQFFRKQTEISATGSRILLQDEPKASSPPLRPTISEASNNIELFLKKIEQDLDEASLTEAEKLLSNALGNDAVGRTFFRFIKANDHYSEVPNKQFYIKHFFSKIEKNTNATRQITSVLDRISGDKYFYARVRLMNLLGGSPKLVSLLKPLVQKEINYIPPVGISEEPIDFSDEAGPTLSSTFTDDLASVLDAHLNVIHLNVISGSKTPDEIVDTTVEAIIMQKNPRVQLALVDQFCSMVPQYKEQLEQKLLENKIQLPPSAPEEAPAAVLQKTGQKTLLKSTGVENFNMNETEDSNEAESIR